MTVQLGLPVDVGNSQPVLEFAAIQSNVHIVGIIAVSLAAAVAVSADIEFIHPAAVQDEIHAVHLHGGGHGILRAQTHHVSGAVMDGDAFLFGVPVAGGVIGIIVSAVYAQALAVVVGHHPEVRAQG